MNMAVVMATRDFVSETVDSGILGDKHNDSKSKNIIV